MILSMRRLSMVVVAAAQALFLTNLLINKELLQILELQILGAVSRKLN
jgi:hypothetical protein